ncbi:thioredoxin family protein [Lederbergia citrisecunda]|uniref:thioredoxin family protein n=1 Tax=Lederbergia citrisecunda TaxID=2833583 RepID=UPI003D27D53D
MEKLIKFEKEQCMPCRMVESLLKSKGIEAVKYDVLKDSELVEQYGIMSVPTVILLDDNNSEIQRVTGFKPAELEELISKL